MVHPIIQRRSDGGGGGEVAEVDQLSVRWAWAARAWAVGGVSHGRILRESSEI